ncbi:hypothetical protein ACLK1T_23285 [Escherichia coli]
MTTTHNKAFLMNLPVWSVIHTCSPIPQKRPSQGLPFWSGPTCWLSVFPGSLLEFVAGAEAWASPPAKIILMQAANTGLTED